MNIEKIKHFKKETQEDILSTLKAYKAVHVTRYELTGREEVSVGTCIKASYTEEERSAVMTTVKAEDIYTAEERADNFEEVFGYRR